ncbi:unnamed protein product [Macrosiphum euphorbiae]|uniref:Endonuclease/exonuclease/phosphatase domain-containing protein n=1 Tax=Macrosiphum euphorbiae TaxID=13131 RepID=A0AAV0WQ20_9HEMI|nr:unnamed protein product [Macrosiphum euphorbiae]
MKIVTDQIQKYKLPVVALQEVRWPGSGSVKSENYTIFYSGSTDGRHERGVGSMVNDIVLPHVKGFTPVSDRLCVLKLEENFWDIIVVNCYAPTEEGNNDIKNEFYEELERIYDIQPRNCMKILVGDFNAQIGREPLYRSIIGIESLHLISNNNGMRVINFASSKDLVVSSTFFPEKGYF